MAKATGTARAKARKPSDRGGVSGVKYSRDELNVLLPIYYMIRDCIDGEPAIKGIVGTTTYIDPSVGNGGGNVATVGSPYNIVLTRARRYLPMPNPEDQSPANVERYRSYVQRAVFYNVVSRTLDGMVGQIFLIAPVKKTPSQLDNVLKNVDGQGLTDIQLAKRAARYTLSFGRAGVFTDYPSTNGAVTAAQANEGGIQPVIRVFPPWNIINWRTKIRGAKTILSLVVLREQVHDIGDDGFTMSPSEQYRVLRLDDNDVYTQEIYGADGDVTTDAVVTPKDAKGKTFNEIPFSFIGAVNNDDAVDKPPLEDLSILNLAHYRNSADYEEASFIVGQPTPIFIGLTQEWVDHVLKGAVPLGARAAVPLPVGADAKLLQANPNSMPLEAMKQKEDQMVSIGAKLVIQKRVQRTATEAVVDAGSEQSVLADVADNVSSAFESALGFAARFVGADAADISYKLNKDFELNRLTMDDVSKLIASWQAGAICFEEMRDGVRKAGIASKPDDEAKQLIQDEAAAGMLNMGIALEPSGAANVNGGAGGAADHAIEPATQGR